MQYCLIYACGNNATNASTSRRSLLKIGPVTLSENRLEVEIVLQLGSNMTIVVHSPRWRSQTDGNIAIPILASYSVIISVHRVKFW